MNNIVFCPQKWIRGRSVSKVYKSQRWARPSHHRLQDPQNSIIKATKQRNLSKLKINTSNSKGNLLLWPNTKDENEDSDKDRGKNPNIAKEEDIDFDQAKIKEIWSRTQKKRLSKDKSSS